MSKPVYNCIVFTLKEQKRGVVMDKLTESLIKHLCPTCCGNCDKGAVIIQTKEMLQLYCPDYKPNRDKIRKLAYKDSKTITAQRSKAIMDLNI